MAKIHFMFSDRTHFNAPPNALSKVLEHQKNRGCKILDLTLSNPTKIGLNYNYQRISTALSRRQASIYDPNPWGLWEARVAVSGYYRGIGVDVDADSICLTASTSEAYAMLFKLLGNPGDQILVPSPGYPLLSFLARFESLQALAYPLRYAPGNGWYFDFDAIEARITPKTRAVVVVSPNNPTGTYIKRDEIPILDEICRRNNLALIIDEVFSDYADNCADEPLSSSAGRFESLCFVLNGFSKMVALPQVKLGWIVVTGMKDQVEIAKSRLEMLLDFYLSVSSYTQHAVKDLLSMRGEIQSQIDNRIALNQMELGRQLAETTNCQLLLREGGWYAVVEIDDHWKDESRVLTLISRDHTLVHPGYFYDFHRDGFVVLSLLPPCEQFQQGIERLVRRFGRS